MQEVAKNSGSQNVLDRQVPLYSLQAGSKMLRRKQRPGLLYGIPWW